VRLERLLITNYRNLARAEIELRAGSAAFLGENAQGKSNLLEAIYMLATMRSLRAESDAQVIRQEALGEVLPAARIVGEIATRGGPLKVEVTVMMRPGGNGASKTVKVNGVSRRLSGAVGRMMAVLFTAEDMEMLTGSPSLRRRYLDITLSQVDSQYSTSRSRFDRLLTQRNALLKRIREGSARSDELTYWDGELSLHGGIVMQRRANAVIKIAQLAAASQAELAPGELLHVAYMPSLDIGEAGQVSDGESLTRLYATRLAATLDRDVAAGMTLTGPHRDDVGFALNGFDAASYASRAQQRTIALALRLAEASFLTTERGEPPVLLLDDILSEMDFSRRETVMSSIGHVDQVLVTGTEAERFPREFLNRAKLYVVERGSVQPLVLGQPLA
jgi:DNA replication and repair protein RecF